MAGTQPARGMRDFLPEDVRRRQYVIGVIADVYQRYGFEPLETPAVENIETLLGKYGDEGDKLIFKILKRGEGAQTGEADLALRYDLTVPLARVVAEYRAKLPKFFKRYQVQPVWRADRPQKGRFREFYQCDVDAIGSESPIADAELLAAASDVLEKLGFEDFQIHLNHRQVLTGLLNGCGVPVQKHGDALVALDKLDKVGREGVRRELRERGFDEGVVDRLTNWWGATDGPGYDPAWLDWLEKQFSQLGEQGRRAVQNLRDIISLLQTTSAGSHLKLDPNLARGLSYYTGAIFEIRVPQLAGSLGGGGRYDELIGMFLGERVPATGISLGLERILVVMGEREMFPSDLVGSSADVMVLAWPENLSYALEIASSMRADGLRVEMYPEPHDKMEKKMKYAVSRNVPCVAIVGEEEAGSRTVVMRDMTTRAQAKIPCANAAAFIKARRSA